ncbi:MAG: hypothetical protein Q9214_005469 [Letrouitia sp. 1 TL-2023]
MSKAVGSPLRDIWDSRKAPYDSRISQEQKEKVVFQLGFITEALSRLCFSEAGSVFEEDRDGEFRVSTCLSRGLLLNQRYAIENIPRGPFRSDKEYYTAHMSAYIEQARYFPLGHHCFFAPIPARNEYRNDTEFRKASNWWSDFVTVQSKIDSSENRVDYIIAGEVLSDVLLQWIDNHSTRPLDDSGPRFAVHHPDLSVNNIFVDAESNITCIIDWAFCSTVPLSTLLTAPGLPQSRCELDASLSSVFEVGFQYALRINAAAHTASINSELSLLRYSRLVWLFLRISSFDSTADFHLFQAIWELLGDSQSLAELFRSKQTLLKYKSLYRELKEDDQTQEEVARSEGDYFRGDVEGLAISRKLTLVSEWSSRYCKPQIRSHGNTFVADKTLWNWISNSLDPYHHQPL